MREYFKKHGVFSWNELMTSDVESAKKFYGELFGWTFEASPSDCCETYHVAKAGDAPAAGLMALPPDVSSGGVPSHWGSYVTVDDLNLAAQKTVELGGGIIIPPREIPGMGSFSVIKDPQGAVICMFEYLKP